MNPSRARTPPLHDPSTFGEDLRGNLERVIELAPVHCRGCADYHIRCVAHRAAGARFGIDGDRPQLVGTIAGLVARLLSGRGGKIDIVIAGSADTGILATAAHAVATLGREALARCRFTVLDLCPTPLMLCEDFARSHGLDLGVSSVDLTDPARDFPGDLVLLHSVFRFIDSARQPAVLARLAGWVRPGGAMVFSNRIKSSSSDEAARDIARRRAANERFLAMAGRGALPAGSDPAEIEARLERQVDDEKNRTGEFRDAADLLRVLETCGLALTRFDEIVAEIGGGDQPSVVRRRVLAVLEAR